MDLIIDIGNTRAKLAWFNRERIMRVAIMTSGDHDGIIAEAQREHLEAVAIGSVGQDAALLIAELSVFAPVTAITGSSPAPIRNDYATPLTLGADRLANAVAASALFPERAVLAIDAGSCITFDVVRPGGVYAGGAISPGLGMRAKAMHDYSARLPLVQVDGTGAVPFASTTQGALLSGVWQGALHECAGFIGEFRRQYPGGAVVLAGGDGLRLSRGLKSGIFAHPFLTLEGYRRILHHHRTGLGRV